MSAIIKTIPIHSSSLNPLMAYCNNKEKTSVSMNLDNVQSDTSALLNYAMNPLKTICNIDENHKELLITGIQCNAQTAAQEFQMAKDRYRRMTGKTEQFKEFEYLDKKTGKMKTVQRQPVTAMHIIQSFKEPDIDPLTVHQIGVEMVERLKLQGVVNTHLNKAHLHNHLIINVYRPDGTKWNCDLEERLRIRELSDQLQREYGIEIAFEEPREQLALSKGKTYSYKEWAETDKGTSWKDQMKNDIAAVASIAKNKAEYLSMMEAYGYKVEKDNGKYLTFQIKGSNHKINDRTLGYEYSIEALYPEKEQEKQEVHVVPLQKTTVSVSKYNADGTRRGALEMFIRKIIAMLQKILPFWKAEEYAYVSFTPKDKIKMLEDALDVIKENNLHTKEELKERRNVIGTELSIKRTEVKKLETEKPLYDKVLGAINEIEMLRDTKTNTGDLYLHNYTEAEIRSNRSKIAPCLPSEKSAIAVALYEKPEYRLKCKYSELLSSEVEQVLAFLKGDTKEMPALLITDKEYEQENLIKVAKRIREKTNEALQNKYANQKPSQAILEQIKPHLEGQQINLSELSVADVIEIRNCFSQNPFQSPVLDEAEQNKLASLLQERHLQSNRELQYITKKEASLFYAHLKDPQKYKAPSFLSPYSPPSEHDVEYVNNMMKLKNISFTVPVDKLSKADLMKVHTYLSFTGEKPACLQLQPVQNNILDAQFTKHAEKYDMQRILYLSQYREALNMLRSAGYQVDQNTDLTELKQDIQKWLDTYEQKQIEKDELRRLYHDLIKTENTITKAAEKSFLTEELKNSRLDVLVQEAEIRESINVEQKDKEEHAKRAEKRKKDFYR